MKVLIVEPGKPPYEKDLDGSLASLRREVGGPIEAVYPFDDPVVIICNDTGKLDGLPPNRRLRDETGCTYDIIAGTFIVAGLGKEDFKSLSPELLRKYTEYYALPEYFGRVLFDGDISAQKTPGESNVELSDTPHSTEQKAPQISKDKRREELASRVEQLTDSFREDPRQLVDYLQFARRFNHYSFRNLAMILTQRPDARFVASMSFFNKGCPDKHGTRLTDQKILIRKGERALYIWCPTETLEVNVPGKGWTEKKRLTSSERKQALDELWEARKGLRYILVPVFDIGQTTAPRELYPKLCGLGEESRNADLICERVVGYAETELGCRCFMQDDVNALATARGYFDPTLNEIHISKMLAGKERLSTLLHELAHAEMHSLEIADSRGNSEAQKELEADMLSIMLCDRFGLDITSSRLRHLQGAYNKYFSEILDNNGQLVPGKDTEPFDTVIQHYRKTAPTIARYINIDNPERSEALKPRPAEDADAARTDTPGIDRHPHLSRG